VKENPSPGAAVSGSMYEPAAGPPLQLVDNPSSEEATENSRRFYNELSRQLDSTRFGSFSYFLNYGYVADESLSFSAIELPQKYINRNSVRLVLEVIGDCDLKHRRILDVGCGRGGTIHVMHQFFQPGPITGLDLSAHAIRFCRRVHTYPGATFCEGDAEKLPFRDSAFDVVTNVESSHTYPNLHAFYVEVYRLLAPGGCFLYTDIMQREKSKQCLDSLQSLGFEVETDRDITGNVLRSCDEVAVSRLRAFQGANDAGLMRDFLAAPGSQVYENMKRGEWTYRILRMRKKPPL
jgi:phthiocerol/phenolphthiocerol synthesis type-I polyketide synthase E